MKRSALQRAGRLKRRRRHLPKAVGLHDTVTLHGQAPCWFHDLGGCHGPMDPHHLFPQQLLRRELPHGVVRGYLQGRLVHAQRMDRIGIGPLDYEFAEGLLDEVICVPLTALLSDARNCICACRHHHAQVEACQLRIARPDLPAALHAFARDCGLSARLDTLFP